MGETVVVNAYVKTTVTLDSGSTSKGYEAQGYASGALYPSRLITSTNMFGAGDIITFIKV